MRIPGDESAQTPAFVSPLRTQKTGETQMNADQKDARGWSVRTVTGLAASQCRPGRNPSATLFLGTEALPILVSLL